MKKPTVGILASRVATDGNGCGRHFVNDTYVSAIVKTGGLPFMIPVCDEEEDRDAYLAMCDGILAPGGHDVNPLFYSEEPHPLLGETSSRFDRFQLAMLQKAAEKKIPVLGICRGIQAMNVAAGGTLYQDVSLQRRDGILMHEMTEKDRGAVGHSVEIEEGSRLYGMFGGKLLVNSFHHQAVKALGDGFRVTARAKDGTVEAIEHEGDVFRVGVQWHLEVMFEANDGMRPLFRAFVEAAEDAAQR